MKTFLFSGLSILAALAFSACNKPAPEPEVVVRATPTPTPEPNYFAPEGVYYLLTPASIEVDDSLHGLYPGTRMVIQADGRYLADGFKTPIELRPNQVTNDLRIANRAIQAQLEAARQRAAQSATAPAGTESYPPAPLRQPVPTAPPVAPPRINPLDAPARRVNPDYPPRYRKPGTAF